MRKPHKGLEMGHRLSKPNESPRNDKVSGRAVLDLLDFILNPHFAVGVGSVAVRAHPQHERPQEP